MDKAVSALLSLFCHLITKAEVQQGNEIHVIFVGNEAKGAFLDIAKESLTLGSVCFCVVKKDLSEADESAEKEGVPSADETNAEKTFAVGAFIRKELPFTQLYAAEQRAQFQLMTHRNMLAAFGGSVLVQCDAKCENPVVAENIAEGVGFFVDRGRPISCILTAEGECIMVDEGVLNDVLVIPEKFGGNGSAKKIMPCGENKLVILTSRVLLLGIIGLEEPVLLPVLMSTREKLVDFDVFDAGEESLCAVLRSSGKMECFHVHDREISKIASFAVCDSAMSPRLKFHITKQGEHVLLLVTEMGSSKVDLWDMDTHGKEKDSFAAAWDSADGEVLTAFNHDSSVFVMGNTRSHSILVVKYGWRAGFEGVEEIAASVRVGNLAFVEQRGNVTVFISGPEGIYRLVAFQFSGRALPYVPELPDPCFAQEKSTPKKTKREVPPSPVETDSPQFIEKEHYTSYVMFVPVRHGKMLKSGDFSKTKMAEAVRKQIFPEYNLSFTDVRVLSTQKNNPPTVYVRLRQEQVKDGRSVERFIMDHLFMERRRLQYGDVEFDSVYPADRPPAGAVVEPPQSPLKEDPTIGLRMQVDQLTTLVTQLQRQIQALTRQSQQVADNHSARLQRAEEYIAKKQKEEADRRESLRNFVPTSPIYKTLSKL